MTTYLVKFYKTLLSSDGHPFKCLQCEISVRDVATLAQAIERAQHEVETSSHATDWRHQADLMEIIEQMPASSAPAEPAETVRHAA